MNGFGDIWRPDNRGVKCSLHCAVCTLRITPNTTWDNLWRSRCLLFIFICSLSPDRTPLSGHRLRSGPLVSVWVTDVGHQCFWQSLAFSVGYLVAKHYVLLGFFFIGAWQQFSKIASNQINIEMKENSSVILPRVIVHWKISLHQQKLIAELIIHVLNMYGPISSFSPILRIRVLVPTLWRF